MLIATLSILVAGCSDNRGKDRNPASKQEQQHESQHNIPENHGAHD